jgi:crotonobetainyl-CoA:carnitine CoA-transferase CaiB-like acyl-CoA transferase
MNYSREEILDLLQEKRIPAGGVFNIQEVFGVKEAQSMLLKAQTSDREIKGVRSVAFTTEKQKDNGTLSPPPAYGEHTHQVLSDILSCNEQKINNLIKKGVVYARNK